MSSPGGPRSDEYGALVVARKACRICVERSPGKIRSCAEFDFDPDVVSHWEAWLGHKRPKLLAVGQDFGNVGYFVRNRGRDDPYNQTTQICESCSSRPDLPRPTRRNSTGTPRCF